jgi:SnoaL-like domain
LTTDKIEIMELTARYALSMDEHNVESWLNTWCEDGKWEGALGTYAGRANLPRLLRDLGERNIGRRHVISNFVIDIVSETEATQTCYMQIFAYKEGYRVVATAVYRDRLRKNNGRWLFAQRTLRIDN